jgi:glycosyltransferase involved in cell wall biosynthesis
MTAPFPAIAGTDAVYQEAALLKDHFGGDLVTAYPFKKPRALIPRQWFGRDLAGDAERIRQQYDCIHLYGARFLNFPFLKTVGLPVVYTVSAALGIRLGKRPRWLTYVVSADPGIVDTVRKSWNIGASHILPGIAPPAKNYGPPPGSPPFLITCASGPWTRRQLQTKGFVLLLETVKKLPDVRLQLIWRGLYDRELRQLIRRCRASDRVSVISGDVDVSRYIADGHAAVLLAENRGLVKSYPHSLIKALQVGRPVILNDQIIMSDFVRTHRCGVVVKSWSTAALSAAITELRDNYSEFRQPDMDMARCFSTKRFLAEHEKVYTQYGSTDRFNGET